MSDGNQKIHNIQRDLYLKGIQTGKILGPTTGKPTQDKPWLKYYSDETIMSEIPEMTAYDMLLVYNHKHTGKTALNYFNRKISFDELFSNIDRVAKAFISYGVRNGDIVTISMPNMPESVYMYYALSKIGAVANMVDPRTSPDGFNEYLKEVNSDLLVVIDVLGERIPSIVNGTSVKNIVSVSPSDSLPFGLKLGYKAKEFIEKNGKKTNTSVETIKWNDFVKSGDSIKLTSDSDVLHPKYVKDKPSLIVHTGGTTGSPKGVVLTNDNINAMAFQSMAFPTDLKSEHRWLDIMPPFIAYGIGSGLHFPLCNGMETVLIPQFDPKKLDELVLKYKPQHIAGAPTHWNYFIKSKKLQNKDLSYLITCAVGGDSLNLEVEKEANKFLIDRGSKFGIAKGYGMTETNGSIGRTTNENNELGSVGIPFAHSLVGIFDPETGEELGYNQLGEICMAGPNVMLEYYNNEEQTKMIKRRHEDGIDWIHSGDIGYMNEHGNIFVVNRMKRIIIRHDGFKLFPTNIEKVIESHPNVESCVVVGMPDVFNNQGKLPCAYILPKDSLIDLRKLEEEITLLCESKLPEYSQLERIKFVDSIPYTPIGKIDALKLEKEIEQEVLNEVKQKSLK